MGISLLIVGSFIPWIYYGFYCRREPKITYIAVFLLKQLLNSFQSFEDDWRHGPGCHHCLLVGKVQ